MLAVSSGHAGEVPAGGVGVSTAMDSISGMTGHTGEVPAGGAAISTAIGSISGTTGPAGEVPPRGVPVPTVGGGISLLFFQLVKFHPVVSQFQRRVAEFPHVVFPVGEVPVCATSGG